MKTRQIWIALAATALMACGADSQTSTESSGKAQSTQSAREAYSEIYDSGQIKITGWMESGKRVGDWKAYYENGVRWSEDRYRDGMRDGPTVSYYPNGLLRYRGQFIEDKKAGTWQYYNDEGVLMEEIDFNK